MRKNNKGFTLIELLAVLIVISLIALITVTNVSKMLSKSKDTLYSNQVKQIEKAARVWGADHIMILPSDSNSENTCNYDEIEECSEKYKTLTITLKTLQDGGYIDKDIKNPKNNKIIDPDTIIIITKNGKSIDYKVDLDDGSSFAGTIDTSKQYSTAHVEQLGLKGVAYLDPTNLETECNASNSVSTPGTKTGCMKFYIFDDSGDTYKMILDHNTTSRVAYETSGTYKEYEQASIKATVDSDTTGWKKSLKSRLITVKEIANITNTTTLDGNGSTWFYFDGTGDKKQKKASSTQGASPYSWLFNYTNRCTSNGGCDVDYSSTSGYWTSSPTGSPYSVDAYTYAWYVASNGSLNTKIVDNSSSYGVRPVIEIDKSIIDGDDEFIEPSKPEKKAFETDSWSTIAANTTSDKYKVGDEKCITLTGLKTLNDNGCSNGKFKIRIANKTACTTETSQTACGFVVEFVDVISEYNMNSTNTNVGGYPASALYNEYFASNATNSIYAKLPSDLRSKIINTTVVSGHGVKSGESNFTSIDKLYLLSPKEVGLDVDYDTAKNETRKLDYYLQGSTDEANLKRAKQYHGGNKVWWLRTAYPDATTYVFYAVRPGGSSYDGDAVTTYGVSPAFRIGK